MITLSQYRGKNVGVFGLGKAGEATVAALLAGGAKVFAWDDGETSRDALEKKLPAAKLATLVNWPWETLACMCLSPGVPFTHPAPHPAVNLAREKNVPILGEMELLYQHQPRAHYIGITGTNGKSTTTTLIAHLLTACGARNEVGGNLGTPALALQPLEDVGHYVIEMSSYQLDLIDKTRFHIALLLNLTPDHLDRHGDMQGYIAAKKRIFMNQQAGDKAIVAVDDEHTRRIADEVKNVVRVSYAGKIAGGVGVENGVLYDALEAAEFKCDLTKIATLAGKHNWQNAAAAWAAARLSGIPAAELAKAIVTFPGLAHRMEQMGTIGNVRFVNDSKATNADAAQHALAAYENIFWIAGGKAKEGGIESLAPLFPRITHAFLIGDAAKNFAATLGKTVAHTHSETLENAVAQAHAAAAKSGRPAVVLLSPACASFDQFKSFEHRGDVFHDLVKREMEKLRHAS